MSWYAIIPSEVLSRKDITPNHKLLLGLVASLSHQKGHCFASNQYIGECLGISSAMVRVLIKRLEELNLITRLVKYRDNKEVEIRELKLSTPLLTQLPPPANTVPPLPQQISIPSPTTLAHIYKDNSKEINKEIKAEISIVDDGFETFWKTYDKNIDKKKCYTKWKLIRRIDKDKILAVVADYVKANPEPRYRRNPYNYLNNEGWNDTIIKPISNDVKIERKPIDNSAFEIKIPEGW